MVTYGFKSREYLPNNIHNFFVNELSGKYSKNLSAPDFGHYKTAKKLGWGFPSSHTYKKYLNNLFKNENFYPQSMVINKNFVMKNKKSIDDFMKNGRYIIKHDKGYGGKNIFIVKNTQEIMNKINNQDWVLQKIIEPVLFNGYKFDFRIYHFILRYKNDYYNIFSKVGFCKSSVHSYNPNSDKPHGFITNVLYNNGTNKKHMHEVFDFIRNFEKEKSKQEEMKNKIYDIIRRYSKILVRTKRQNNKGYDNLKAQIMIYGPDILFDQNKKPYLLETNCSPGFLLRGEIIYNKQKALLKELINNILVPILEDKELKLDNYKGNTFFIEKI
jgi:hypothetical protein